jgi:hypothetical protein
LRTSPQERFAENRALEKCDSADAGQGLGLLVARLAALGGVVDWVVRADPGLGIGGRADRPDRDRPRLGSQRDSFVPSALPIGTLRIPAHAGQLGSGAKRGLGSNSGDARAGLAFARHDRFVSRPLLMQALASLTTGATGAMLVMLSERHLHLAPAGVAWLIGAIGVGALLGPLIPNTLARDHHDARWLFVPQVIRGIGDVLLGSSRRCRSRCSCSSSTA